MTRNFHRWEVDPFFSAAEEVQDSADRLESVFRTWMHVKCAADDNSVVEFHRRELSTALGTAKWQLEEFERAVYYVTVDDSDCAGDDSPTRHKQFVDALQSQISSIELALMSSEDGRDLKPHQVVKLGEKEKQDLELFLCGSRPSVCNNIKEAGPCADAASNAGKADVGALCAILDSSEGKNGIAPYVFTSAGNSDVDSANLKSDDGPWMHGSNKSLSHFDKVSNGNLLRERIDEISKPVSDPTPDHYLSDRTETYGERANGQLRSVSVGSGLNAWKSGSTNDTRIKKRKLISVQIPSTRLNFWSVFAKARQPRSWRSGLKRWKDGDANASDSEMLALIQGDIEEGNGNLWLGGKPSNNATNDVAGGDSKHCRAVGDGFQMWQRSHYALPSSRPVQIMSAILVALGLVGLLSFHVSSSAL